MKSDLDILVDEMSQEAEKVGKPVTRRFNSSPITVQPRDSHFRSIARFLIQNGETLPEFRIVPGKEERWFEIVARNLAPWPLVAQWAGVMEEEIRAGRNPNSREIFELISSGEGSGNIIFLVRKVLQEIWFYAPDVSF